ncbi:BglG family transcriptional antiterminator [Enterobacter sp. BIGb0383]|uniref:stationary phase inducible protein CsiE n=1 Tax=unclassified Enterobacter TaxID=2608935 RepID=UPI000F49AECE|nr:MULTISPECIES: stationary phase inducible protein CsiE [unclassified Enterobacter]ROP63121.1 BglG family transcriptional antiterminator [Enterobacter sp. BIGb0383]ROS13282.1 BglG family transcriptional antiterminator [Enterobacter sp. BIGb0359]
MTIIDQPPSLLSSPQRRCQVLLMLYLPEQAITTALISELNGVDDAVARQDIAETGTEIQRYHQLTIALQQDGSYRIEGTPLDRRLCLMHWLRRALRLCPQFISHHFTPALKTQLKQRGLARTLYDDTNLQALVNLCGRRLQRQFAWRDIEFLRLYLQYCLLQHQMGITPEFNPAQRQWTQTRMEYPAVQEIVRHWQRRVVQPPHDNEHLFLALLFILLRIPDPLRDDQQHDHRLRRAITAMISRFRESAGLRFNDEQGLIDRLYIHLAQALDRSLFGIGIDNSLTEEVGRLYPRLMRTTREAFHDFECTWGLQFSEEEIGLVAVIFGAWLMQEKDLQEKQVLLLTANDPRREQALEQQLRELTLLPLNIKYLPLADFQQHGAPKEVALIVTPYTTPLPLFSPPLIHAQPSLSTNQCRHIRTMLES